MSLSVTVSYERNAPSRAAGRGFARRLMAAFLMVGLTLALATVRAQAVTFTEVVLPTGGGTVASICSAFPTGNFVAQNAWATPFHIATSTMEVGTWNGSGPNPSTVTLNISGAQTLYTLMNVANPSNYVTFTFHGSGATPASYTMTLAQNVNYRNIDNWGGSAYNQLSAATTENALTVSNFSTGWDGTNANTYYMDEQAFALPTAFASQTLTSVTISSSGPVPVIYGMTVASPEPAIMFLFAGLFGLMLERRR